MKILILTALLLVGTQAGRKSLLSVYNYEYIHLSEALSWWVDGFFGGYSKLTP